MYTIPTDDNFQTFIIVYTYLNMSYTLTHTHTHTGVQIHLCTINSCAQCIVKPMSILSVSIYCILLLIFIRI